MSRILYCMVLESTTLCKVKKKKFHVLFECKNFVAFFSKLYFWNCENQITTLSVVKMAIKFSPYRYIHTYKNIHLYIYKYKEYLAITEHIRHHRHVQNRILYPLLKARAETFAITMTNMLCDISQQRTRFWSIFTYSLIPHEYIAPRDRKQTWNFWIQRPCSQMTFVIPNFI